MNPKIIQEEPVSMAEMKDVLEKIKERDGELNFRSNKTLDYLNGFVQHSYKDVKPLIESIQKLEISRLKIDYILKIVDIMPRTEESLKSIMSGYNVTVKSADMKKIVEEVNAFLS